MFLFIRPETLSEILEEFRNRHGSGLDVNGMHFEQLIHFLNCLINKLTSHKFNSPFISKKF